MIKTVIDRKGNMREFDAQRIISAIIRAASAAEEKMDIEFAQSIAKYIQETNENNIAIEKIQDLIEEHLMKSIYSDTAKAFIIYRKRRELERAKEAKRLQAFNELIEIVDNNIKNDNANMNGNTPAGQMMKFASLTSNEYAEEHLISEKYAQAHKDGLIHIHDKDYYPTKTTNCCMYDLAKILKNGFNPGHGHLREPNSIRSAAALTAIVFQTNQNEQYGGQAVGAFDVALAPYVKKSFRKHFTKFYEYDNPPISVQDLERQIGSIEIDNQKLKDAYPRAYQKAYEETVDETDQAMEAFIANMCSMHSRGKQYCPAA